MPLLFLAAQLTAGVLLAFSLRRALLLLAALWPSRRPIAPARPHPSLRQPTVHSVSKADRAGGAGTPTLVLLTACRNESASLPGLFAALDRLDYPHERLLAAVVDDGSADGSPAQAQAWAAARPWARSLVLPRSLGKAAALNEALRLLSLPAGSDDIVVIYDADHRPAGDSVPPLLAPFADERVAAVSGQMRVVNGGASPAAFYTHLESLVNQFITMRAKDRLDLAPALLGSNCAYRRSALLAVGGFRAGALLEDTDLTLAFAQAGRRTRFVAEAVSGHRAPATLAGYLRQHLRWNRGFHQVGGVRLGALWRNPRLAWRLKLELTFFALGYADRLALLAGLALTGLDVLRPGAARFPLAVWAVYCGLPALEMVAALRLAREPLGMYLRLAYVPFFFALDVGVAAWSAAQSALRRPVRWQQTERAA